MNKTKKERPIIFSGESVRAILEGRKTQTRRAIKLTRGFEPGTLEIDEDGRPVAVWRGSGCLSSVPCPYGQPGDLLWVKQPWAAFDIDWRWMDDWREASRFENRYMRLPETTCDAEPKDFSWRNARFMPKRAAQLWPRVVDVRAERLQEGQLGDIWLEGYAGPEPPEQDLNWDTAVAAVDWWKASWDSLNARRPGCSWSDNPRVWVIGFAGVER